MPAITTVRYGREIAAEQSTIVIQVNDATTGVSLVRKIVVGQFI